MHPTGGGLVVTPHRAEGVLTHWEDGRSAVFLGEDTAGSEVRRSLSAPSTAGFSPEKGPAVAPGLFLSQALPAGRISVQLDGF